MIAVEVDSSWFTGKYDVVTVHVVPRVAVLDTTGVMLECFVNARDPVWSPGGERLAFRIVRPSTVRGGNEVHDYPEADDSVVVWNATTRHRMSVPAPAEVIGWQGEELLTATTRGRGYAIQVRDGMPFYWSYLVEVRAGEWSPSDRFSFVLSPNGSLSFWDQGSRRDDSAWLRQKIGGSAQNILSAFWVANSAKKDLLCIGTMKSYEPGKPWPAKKPVAQVIVLDVRQDRVIRRFTGAFMAPFADRTGVVFRRSGATVFESLTRFPEFDY